MSQPEYVCKICLKDLTRDVKNNEHLFFEPAQTLRVHYAICVRNHKAELLDTFCHEWISRLTQGFRANDLAGEVEQLLADWQKLERLGEGE